MRCAICKKDKSGKEQTLVISGKEYSFFVCNECEAEKGKDYINFFDNIRENLNIGSE